MIQKTRMYSLCITFGIWCSPALAGDQIFEIKNPLTKIDLEGTLDEYIDAFNQVTDDLKNDGIKFTYSGTRVATDTRGAPYFEVKDVHIVIKKDFFEKNTKYSELISKQTLFKAAQDKFDIYYIFNQANGTNTKLSLRMEVLDSTDKVLCRDHLSTIINNHTDVTYIDIFDYLNKTKSENKAFSDIDISNRFSTDYQCHMPLTEIQKINSIKFSTIDNPNLSKR